MKREEIEEYELKTLHKYATFSKYAERSRNITRHPYRTEFQRDRDRILHAKAFRRLEYKTQVFLTQKGDHLRTRLTHSLEVSQLSRTIAIQLGLNLDLIEAISLGHDLGHTPFGHAGEKELNRLLQKDGAYGFKHNVQSVKIIKLLEKKYPYDGLELTIPVIEGILKHTKLPNDVPDFCQNLYMDNEYSVTLEGQIVAIADEIAQITHDMDDYLRYNIINYDSFIEHSIFEELETFYQEKYNYSLDSLMQIAEVSRRKDTTIRCLIDYLITMLIQDSRKRLNDIGNLKSLKLNRKFIDFKAERKEIVKDFYDYLYDIIFSDYKIIEMDIRGKNIINTLYNFFKEHPDKMPEKTFKKYEECNGNKSVIGDYISGMTDRYALNQYNSIIDVEE